MGCSPISIKCNSKLPLGPLHSFPVKLENHWGSRQQKSIPKNGKTSAPRGHDLSLGSNSELSLMWMSLKNGGQKKLGANYQIVCETEKTRGSKINKYIYVCPCEWMPPTQRLLWNNKVKNIIITHKPHASMWYPAVNLVEAAELSQVSIWLAGSLPQHTCDPDVWLEIHRSYQNMELDHL